LHPSLSRGNAGANLVLVGPNRAGNVQAALRDTLAARHTLEIAERKAGMSIMSGTHSGEFRAARGDIRPELNHIDGLIVMDGALPIRAAGSLIGAVGVSGAPGGEKRRRLRRRRAEAGGGTTGICHVRPAGMTFVPGDSPSPRG